MQETYQDLENRASQASHEDCKVWMEEVAQYYISLLKRVSSYIEDFRDVVRGESSKSYYSSTQKKTVSIKELETVLRRLQTETYGRK